LKNKNSILNLISADEDSTNNDNNYHQRPKNDNHSYRSYPGQSSSFNNYHGRTVFNRNRNGAFEQVILIRSDCVARIVGKLIRFEKIFFVMIINLYFRCTRF